MTTVSEFQSKILSRQTDSDEYQIYKAALEWDLIDPIVIEGPDDFKSKQSWHDKLEPYHHQITNLITFCRRLPVTLLADDVGLGKTISAGLIASELISRSRLSKILIVCPKLLLPQWQEELDKKFDIPAEIAIGKNLLSAEPRATGAVITTYNSARLYLERIPKDRFQMLILDEAHKLRNLYGTEKPPQVAQCFQQALQERRFKFVLMLTATPIQNRLWDLYSLVDLLATARGHENPLGTQGMFIRNYIGDKKDQARHLKHEKRDDFRHIIYSYMSRMRRGDAKLYFPDRVVQMHAVKSTEAEIKLIETIAKPIQKLNKLAQISILQALTSSPDALLAQLINMGRKGTVPQELVASVKAIVTNMPLSAKLDGLRRLIDQLKKENPDKWRLVVFTGRRETQTTIQAFLESQDLKVGIINGDSGPRNQETLKKFRSNPPDYRVIVSTEAGSEGVNLQVANVLVNYDLPWNPMIVEQRIGRIQRLASEHAHVSIFNIMLRGTFEEYIVGRLMEKLQMAAHAIGDIEALLQGSDISEGDEEDGITGFEDKILKLVLAALAEKDVAEETKLAEKSIENAKITLQQEETNINTLLGSMDGAGYIGPRIPRLPNVAHSLDLRTFALSALKILGAQITQLSNDLYAVEENKIREYIYFENPPSNHKGTLYSASSPAFQQLVGKIIASGKYDIDDLDNEPMKEAKRVAEQWTQSFGAIVDAVECAEVWRAFDGKVLLRCRATVAHDSYERLVEVGCASEEHTRTAGSRGLNILSNTIENPAEAGINVEKLKDAASLDPAVSEFSRFYLERREQETLAANGDERKQKKLYDEFTPRLGITLTGVAGKLHRKIEVSVRYKLDSNRTYKDSLIITPFNGNIISSPKLELCEKSRRMVPPACLGQCEISKSKVIQHLLEQSDISKRLALPEHMATCSLSGKRVLKDEAEISSVSGKTVASTFLKTSPLSNKRAEAEHFGICAFTKSEVLKSELAISEISGKHYRLDEQLHSIVSGKAGHKQEFIYCCETNTPLSPQEAETCEQTGRRVRPGILEVCSITGKKVLPSELKTCSVTNQKALKQHIVTSSISQAPLIKSIAIRSASGQYCTPLEARICSWSERKTHPEDMRICDLTGLVVHVDFTDTTSAQHHTLTELLDGTRRTTEETQLWDVITTKIKAALKNKNCRIESAVLSPTHKYLAVCCEVKTFIGLKTNQIGTMYDIGDKNLIGRIATGKRVNDKWAR